MCRVLCAVHGACIASYGGCVASYGGCVASPHSTPRPHATVLLGGWLLTIGRCSQEWKGQWWMHSLMALCNTRNSYIHICQIQQMSPDCITPLQTATSNLNNQPNYTVWYIYALVLQHNYNEKAININNIMSLLTSIPRVREIYYYSAVPSPLYSTRPPLGMASTWTWWCHHIVRRQPFWPSSSQPTCPGTQMS